MKPDKRQWQKVFFVAAGVYAAGTIVYVIFGNAEEQAWAKSDQEEGGERRSEAGETQQLIN